MAQLVARLSGVTAGYRSRDVLDGVDLAIETGEAIALLGPNGSGKTTLLRVLAGALRPSAGTVELFGRPIEAWTRAEIARVVTVLPQGMELPEGFRVAEVVALGRMPHARTRFGVPPEDVTIVADALADAGASELAARPVGELSGGERQRVLLAMALAQQPRLLLMDEPTLHLDLGHQFALLELVAHLRRARDLTVVAVLHDPNLAVRFADRILLLDRGRLFAAGGTAGLDLGVAARAFGVPLEEARTADGAAVIAVGRGPTRRESRMNHPRPRGL
jgi:iron complex transport system ATP-binding protein